MMIDPSLALQKAVVATLQADSAVTALVADRIFDRVPSKAPFPYCSLGPEQVLDDSDQCHAGAETVLQVDVWSREVGRVEAKRIAAAVAAVLDAPVAVEGHQVVTHAIERVQHLGDPDGITSHSVVVVRYVTAPTS